MLERLKKIMMVVLRLLLSDRILYVGLCFTHTLASLKFEGYIVYGEFNTLSCLGSASVKLICSFEGRAMGHIAVSSAIS